MDYCLPEGYRSRPEPERFVGHGYDGGWQPDVYPEAAALAQRLGVGRIVAVGCDFADELAALNPVFDVVGLDTAENIARCRERYDFGTWLELDLERDHPIDGAGLPDSVVVCKSVIERLVDPERLLRLLSELIEAGAAAVVLSTPDRDLVNSNARLGPPDNPANVREWSTSELSRFLASAGLSGHVGLTRSTGLPPCMTSVLVVVPGEGKRDVVEAWWEERARWQRLVEEQDRTILRQHAWIGELRSTRDWLAQQRLAWESTAVANEVELARRDERIAELDAALASDSGRASRRARTPLRWARRLATPLARVARRGRARRS
jgi:hypothetical protein